ncbi:P-loop containing nucleoside triphosphate hydrolases superfamily protein [Thalictrum thalictroides]|uniref:P-loop containing nucleoside triphosphate hydrolases superfamily protein n=1 Tax=Thalictrum thalictroides TaxID=46969 RepID=A0A7J6W9U1_THATH|nr:P-loop containing nucleoside triphosphate hydrolases superfamily protein [Thalictrum thalictroides]
MILHTEFITFPNRCFSSSYRNFKTFTSSSISFCLKKPTSTTSSEEENPKENKKENDGLSKRKLSEQSSWEAKDSEGKDYLYRLGKEADNMNISVGARAGIIDDLFVGKFLGTDGNSFTFH